MTLEDQKEQFSFAYVRAVAAAAQIAVSEPAVDDDSVDLVFAQRGGGGVFRSPRIEAQVKCTEVAEPSAVEVPFALKIKNYDDLRTIDLLVPRILIVVIVPPEPQHWLAHSEEELALRRCGYWLSLFGEPPVANEFTRTVYLPRVNQFSVAALRGMMQRVGAGERP